MHPQLTGLNAQFLMVRSITSAHKPPTQLQAMLSYSPSQAPGGAFLIFSQISAPLTADRSAVDVKNSAEPVLVQPSMDGSSQSRYSSSASRSVHVSST